jgi:hypothetical protein
MPFLKEHLKSYYNIRSLFTLTLRLCDTEQYLKGPLLSEEIDVLVLGAYTGERCTTSSKESVSYVLIIA